MKNKRVQKLSEQKLLQYGCSKEGMTYRCIRKLKAPDFYAVITYEGQELHAEVYDAQLREPYTPFHVPGANGSFVSSIREEVEELLEDMVQQCIDGNPYRTRILDYVAERYQSYPQFPWKSAPEHGTLKTAKGKWYGVIMHIPYRSLGIDVDGMTDVCNLKNRPEFIQELIDPGLPFLCTKCIQIHRCIMKRKNPRCTTQTPCLHNPPALIQFLLQLPCTA